MGDYYDTKFDCQWNYEYMKIIYVNCGVKWLSISLNNNNDDDDDDFKCPGWSFGLRGLWSLWDSSTALQLH